MSKPEVQLSGTDGNVFMLLGRCTKALKRAGMPDEALALVNQVMDAGSYDEALLAMMAAVDVT